MMGPVRDPLTVVLLPGLDGTGDLFERFVAPPLECCTPRYTPEAFQEAWNAFLNPRLFKESR